VQKARNVQSVGGQAILLVNNIPGEVDNILMIDDGTGNDIHIPLLLISQSDGEIIRSFLIQQYQQPYINPLETVIIDVELNNKLTDHINLELFYSSDDEDFYKFITEYKALQDEFENIITLRTMYFTHSVGNSSDPSDNCVSNGKYCAPIIKSNINGLNVVKEGIFQKCLGIVYNDKTSSLYDVGLYLSYFVEFYNMCYKTKRFNEQCREDVITLLNIDDRKVMHCVKASFKSNTLDDNVYLTKDNHVLERDYRLKKLYDVKSHPVAFVNQKFMDSKLTVHNVLGEVCLMLKKRPEFCVRYFESLKNKEKTYYIMVSVVVFVLVICNLIIFIVCRKYLFNKIKERIEMNSIDIAGRINNTIAKYFQLKDADSGATTTNTNTVESVSLDNENENESANNSGTVETQ
jgi:hypothetical protein